jgi:hypothetical protein
VNYLFYFCRRSCAFLDGSASRCGEGEIALACALGAMGVGLKWSGLDSRCLSTRDCGCCHFWIGFCISAGESNAGLRFGDKSKRGRIRTLLDRGKGQLGVLTRFNFEANVSRSNFDSEHVCQIYLYDGAGDHFEGSFYSLPRLIGFKHVTSM